MKLRTFLFRIFVGVLMVFIGILSVSHNETFTRILIVVCGLVIVCNCASRLFSGSNYKALFDHSHGAKVLDAVDCILGIVIGIIAVIAPIAWADTIGTIVSYALAVFLFFSAFVAARMYFGLLALNVSSNNLLTEFLIDLLLGIILILSPQALGQTLLTVAGIVLITGGLVTLISTIAIKVREKQTKNSVEELN
ncbi:MAG: DUF308 domain-containing protein [Spirochaetales bacterium]|nr:DUF308 domain-containing protein [Spirochaetales bacterium]